MRLVIGYFCHIPNLVSFWITGDVYVLASVHEILYLAPGERLRRGDLIIVSSLSESDGFFSKHGGRADVLC